MRSYDWRNQALAQACAVFDGRGLFVEEHLRPAGECLNVRLVLRKYLNDRLCETVFPSYI